LRKEGTDVSLHRKFGWFRKKCVGRPTCRVNFWDGVRSKKDPQTGRTGDPKAVVGGGKGAAGKGLRHSSD